MKKVVFYCDGCGVETSLGVSGLIPITYDIRSDPVDYRWDKIGPSLTLCPHCMVYTLRWWTDEGTRRARFSDNTEIEMMNLFLDWLDDVRKTNSLPPIAPGRKVKHSA